MMLENLTIYSHLLVYPVVAGTIALVGTSLCVRLLPLFGMVDIPHGRHQHSAPTPRGGGIAIAVGFLVTLLLFYLNVGQTSAAQELWRQLFWFSIAASIIVVTGVIDDRFELPSLTKLLVQVAVGYLIYSQNYGLTALLHWQLPSYIGLPLTICWYIGIINAFNLIDGMDGLAAGLSAIASLCLTVWVLLNGGDILLAVVILCFCFACLGFLRYNFYPAKIFMGDTGSMFIGLFFAFISTSLVSKAATLTALLVPVLAMGVPIFDVFLAIWRRIMRKLNDPTTDKGIMDGDHDHLHHRLLSKEKDQRKTAFVMYGIACIASFGGLLLTMLSSSLPALAYAVFLFLFISALRMADVELLDSANFVIKGLTLPRKGLLITMLHPFIDVSLMALAYTLAFFTAVSPKTGFWLPALCCLAPFVLALGLSGVYRTYWLRAGINRYYLMIKAFFFGGIIGFPLVYTLFRKTFILQNCTDREVVTMYLIFTLLMVFLIAGERFFMRYLESYGLRNFYFETKGEKGGAKRVLIAGGGLHCRLFIQNLFCDLHSQRMFKVLGIIDDNRNLRHLNVYGFKVLGHSGRLEKIYSQTPFDCIVITPRTVNPEMHSRIYEFCQSHNVELRYFIVETSTEYTPNV